MNAAHPPGENQFNLRKIVVDFLRVWTAIFYAYNSVLQQSVPQRIQSAVIPHMYSYAPPPTGSDGCSTSSSSPGKYIIQFLLVLRPREQGRIVKNYFFSISNDSTSADGAIPDFLISRAKRPYIFPLLPSCVAPHLIAVTQILMASSYRCCFS